ncbi:MAG: VOC family protein [Defluviicoccus sp.]|nr:VOC family protein [Defluviicoccus sp.]MDE0276767.1 VOC family protein [Defluviicoccus sp.]
MPSNDPTAPPLVFSHFGYYTDDYDRAVDFWTNAFGFGISDHGRFAKQQICFMTRRPFEHHQLVAISGRDPAHPTTVADLGFLAPSLAELKRIASLLSDEPDVSGVTAVDHGVSWTLHFRDPTGIPVTIDVDTGWFVPQPRAWPLDLDADDETIRSTTLDRCKGLDGFRARGAWRAEIETALAASGKLQRQATPSVGPAPAGAGPVFRNDFDTARSAPFPSVSMFRVGMEAIDLDALASFYVDELGYLVTGRGRRPAVGEVPAADIVYLTRDPGQIAQIVLAAGRPADVPSSINQVTFRVPSIPALRGVCDRMYAHPEVDDYRPVDHGNSFSLYCNDPEGNVIELSRESDWYTPAPSAWPLDLSLSDEEILRVSEERCHSVPGFMMRADWKALARAQLLDAGRLEAEDFSG